MAKQSSSKTIWLCYQDSTVLKHDCFKTLMSDDKPLSKKTLILRNYTISAANDGNLHKENGAFVPLLFVSSFSQEEFIKWCETNLELENVNFRGGHAFCEDYEHKFDADMNPWDLQF